MLAANQKNQELSLPMLDEKDGHLLELVRFDSLTTQISQLRQIVDPSKMRESFLEDFNKKQAADWIQVFYDLKNYNDSYYGNRYQFATVFTPAKVKQLQDLGISQANERAVFLRSLDAKKHEFDTQMTALIRARFELSNNFPNGGNGRCPFGDDCTSEYCNKFHTALEIKNKTKRLLQEKLKLDLQKDICFYRHCADEFSTMITNVLSGGPIVSESVDSVELSQYSGASKVTTVLTVLTVLTVSALPKELINVIQEYCFDKKNLTHVPLTYDITRIGREKDSENWHLHAVAGKILCSTCGEQIRSTTNAATGADPDSGSGSKVQCIVVYTSKHQTISHYPTAVGQVYHINGVCNSHLRISNARICRRNTAVVEPHGLGLDKFSIV